LNGTTIVSGSQVWDRLLSGALGSVTTSTAAVTSSGTTLAVTNGANLPSSGNYYLVMAQEAMQVTGGQGTNSLTVTRGALGTTATAHNSGDNIYLMPQGDIGIFDATKVINAHTMQTGSSNASRHGTSLSKAAIRRRFDGPRSDRSFSSPPAPALGRCGALLPPAISTELTLWP